MIQLRPYQERGVGDIRAAYSLGRKSIAYIAPTGSGKTRILTYIAQGATAKGNRICILVHRQELIRQTANALRDMDVVFGIVAAGHPPTNYLPVQLAMVATLVNRPDAIPPPHLLIIDESHHVVSDSYRQIIARFQNAKILGLTATPQRLDGAGLGSVFEQLVIGPTVQELIDLGFLARPIYYAPPVGFEMKGVRKTAGDFNRRQTSELVDRRTITGNAMIHYQTICPGVPAVAFCTTVKHAENVRDQFNEAGIPSAMIDGKLDDRSREDRVKALGDGRIQILTSVDVISEGFDLPAVTTAILLRPTDSLALHMQSIGRVLRPKANGGPAYVLDHVGNCIRHGLAEEPRAWTLDGRVGKARAAAGAQTTLLTCANCHSVQAPALVCVQCGTVFPVCERQIAETDGTLQQLTAAAILAERNRILKRQEVGRAKSKEDLEAIAKARGHDAKWVRMMLSLRARKQFQQQVDDKIAASAQATFKI